MLSHLGGLGDMFTIYKMIRSIIQVDNGWLVQVWKQLGQPPLHKVGTVEHLVVVSLMVSLLLGAEGPHTPRHQPCFVGRSRRVCSWVWALNCSTEAVATALGWCSCKHNILIII
jgi:hypothetical protein